MRTRRSPKNQETLWRALGGTSEPKPERDPVEVAEAVLAMAREAGRSARTIRQCERAVEQAKRRRALAKARGR